MMETSSLTPRLPTHTHRRRKLKERGEPRGGHDPVSPTYPAGFPFPRHQCLQNKLSYLALFRLSCLQVSRALAYDVHDTAEKDVVVPNVQMRGEYAWMH